MAASLKLVRRRTGLYRITVSQNGAPLNLTNNYTLTFVAQNSNNASQKIEKTSGAGITVLDAPNGVVQLEITPADTVSFADVNSAFVWDLILHDSSTCRDYPVVTRGSLQLLQNVDQ